jgi:hypothetical protein
MTQIIRQLRKDQKIAVVTFPTKPPSTLSLDAEGIKSIITALGELRAGMLPKEPTEFVPTTSVHAIPDPGWTAESELMEGDILLHIRDPGFGWMHYCLPRDTARQLGAHLLALADRPNTAEGKPN